MPLLDAIAISTDDQKCVIGCDTEKLTPIVLTDILPVTQDAIALETDGLGNVKFSELTDIPVSTLEKLKARIKKGETFIPRKYPDFFDKWLLGSDGLWYAKK